MVSDITEEELLKKIECLGELAEDQKKKVACTLIGHSRIISNCFGYIYCGRCGGQIGDTLMGSFDGSKCVLIDHKCETCVENMKHMTWKDKLFCPDTFRSEGVEP